MHETNEKIGSHGVTKLKIKKENVIWRNKPSIRVSIKTEGSEGNDGFEVFTLEPIFYVLEGIFQSEDLRYPKDKGQQGRDYLFKAIKDIWRGKSVDEVLNKYKIPRKVTKLGDIYDW